MAKPAPKPIRDLTRDTAASLRKDMFAFADVLEWRLTRKQSPGRLPELLRAYRAELDRRGLGR